MNSWSKFTGTVNVRPPKNVNPDASTGDIELLAKKLEILNTAKVPVFEIDDNIEAAEDLRLTHRYLDIRRKKCAIPWFCATTYAAP